MLSRSYWGAYEIMGIELFRIKGTPIQQSILGDLHREAEGVVSKNRKCFWVPVSKKRDIHQRVTVDEKICLRLQLVNSLWKAE